MAEQLTFGAELRRRRQLKGLSLAQFEKHVHYTKSYISKVETGAQTAQLSFARMCDAALNANGELIALASPTTHKDEPEDDDPNTGFWHMSLDPDGTGRFTPMPGPAPDLGVGLRLAPGRQVVDPVAAVALFDRRFQEARSMGQVVSATLALPTLIAETHTLRGLAANAPEDSAGLWQTAARYAEYIGWMSQESGNDQQARWWTTQAVRMAERAGDEAWRPFALLRLADMTMYADDALQTIELTQRAQADAAATPRVRGLAAQREAQGHAMLGDSESCLRALDRSAALLDEAARMSATPALGTWTTPDPMLMARGWCLSDLGRPADAAALLEAGIAGFVDGASRARAKCVVRAALAQAQADEIERACELVEWVAADLRQIDSATIRHDVRLLYRELRRRVSQPRVQELLPVLAELLRDPSVQPV